MTTTDLYRLSLEPPHAPGFDVANLAIAEEVIVADSQDAAIAYARELPRNTGWPEGTTVDVARFQPRNVSDPAHPYEGVATIGTVDPDGEFHPVTEAVAS